MTVLDRPVGPPGNTVAVSGAAKEPTAPIVGRRTAGRLTARARIVAASVAGPAAVYLSGQALTVGMLAWLCRVRGRSLLGRLTAWDGGHFLHIAAHGYTFSVERGTSGSPAFLPGYPAVVAALHALTGVPLVPTALAVSWLCGLALACALPGMVRHVRGTDASAELVTVALVAVSPMSVVLAMAYSEALFCALTSWALLFALRHRWWAAGSLGFAAGLVRISGLALAAAFAVAAIITLVTHRHGLRSGVRRALGPGLAALAAAAGTAGWVIGSGLRMGSPTAWFQAQNNGWDSRFDFGAATARFAYRMATTAPNLLEVVTAGVLIGAIVLVVCSVRQHQPALIIVYGAAAVAEVIGSDGIMNSKIRLLIPAFTILLPAAAWLSRIPRRNLITVLIGAGIAGSWLSAYGLTIWPYAI
jgi:hypothetical protein